MSAGEPKDDLLRQLRLGRQALLWKLDGVGEYDARRPLVPTGTNLLGLVKHVAGVESAYLGEVFDRPFAEQLAWAGPDAPVDADMAATAQESRQDIVDLYGRVWQHSLATVTTLPLDTVGRVSWWPTERRATTLHAALVHLIGEVHRHAGHADIVRELIDGAAGLRADRNNLPDDAGAPWWREHHDRVEQAARDAAERR